MSDYINYRNVGTMGDNVNEEYIKEIYNMFPKVVEALRMVLHDTMNFELENKAEIIMSNAYGILRKNNILAPKL